VTSGAATLETGRLRLRELDEERDASFILRLVNDPDWLRFIGDRNVHNLADAQVYIREGPRRMYELHGLGLYLMERKSDREPTGLCGLIKRETLVDVDIGFALLPEFRGRGYVHEAGVAVLHHAQTALGLGRVVAITTTDNIASGRVLEALGLGFERMIRLEPAGDELRLYGVAFACRRVTR
jgi:ribosomal-protein-alanine N-acetyltransferase